MRRAYWRYLRSVALVNGVVWAVVAYGVTGDEAWRVHWLFILVSGYQFIGFVDGYKKGKTGD